jgi:hypothetical protein
VAGVGFRLSPSCATARPDAIDSTNAISATPAGSSEPISEGSGACGLGSSDGTVPVKAMPA